VLASGRPSGTKDGAAEDGALTLFADAVVLAGTLAAGETTVLRLDPGRAAYLVAAVGSVRVNGIAAGPRDGVAIVEETEVTVVADTDAELVVVDVTAE